MNVTETTAECPHCRTHMVQLGGLQGVLAGCRGCGGVWLDNALSAEAAKTPMSSAVHEFVSSLVSASPLGGAVERARPGTTPRRACPVCQSLLRAVPVRDPEMTVDICAQHGTFFDRHELDAMHRIAIRNAELAQLAVEVDTEQAQRDRAWAMGQGLFQGGLIGAALVAASYDGEGVSFSISTTTSERRR